MADSYDEGAATEMVEAYGMYVPLAVSCSEELTKMTLIMKLFTDFLLKFIIIGKFVVRA